MSSRSRTVASSTHPPLDRTAALQAIVPAERRRIVTALLDWPAPADERALAASIAGDERDAPVAEVAGSEAASTARATLQQVHLPALADANLVTWDRTAATVAPTNHPAFRDPMLRRLLQDQSEAADAVVDALADRRRRTGLAVLKAHAGPISTDDLAHEIAIREPDQSTALTDVLVSLRHVHLPKLADAGLIEYDREDGAVGYRGHPALDGPWFGWGSGDDSDGATGPADDWTDYESE